MAHIISWLKKEEPARVIPILDRFLVVLCRVLYLSKYLFLRVLFRFTLGKKRRNKLLVQKKLMFNYDFDIIPVFYYLRFLQFMTKNFRLNKRFLLKITVPHHNYKVYCPINKNDLLNLSIRENEIIEKFHLKKDEIVVDVGAHYGRYTLIAAKHVGHNGKVIAIEADPKNMEILNKNIKLNKLNDENVITINYAVHSKETKIKLYTPAEETGHTIYNTIVPGRIKCEKFIEVKANTLDRLVEEKGVKHEDVNWIKIDVEGAELEVLKGAHNILSKSKDIALLIEVHNISEGQTLYENIMTLLQTYNFKIEFEKIHEGGERHVIMRKI